MTIRTCSSCYREKAETHFGPKKSGGFFKMCTTCRIRKSAYVRSRPKQLFLTTPQLSAKRPLYVHGITQEYYDSMLEAQKGTCFICQSNDGKKLHIDHCHSTGRIRGLLCTKCNLALGCLRDSVDNLERAIVYLRRDYSQAIVHRLFQ